MRVYLVGPMRGKPNENHEAFDEAERRWKEARHQPVSPARLSRRLGFGKDNDNREEMNTPETIREVMIHDVVIICGCDAIAVLPGWEKSRGSTMEVALAKAIDIPIYSATTMARIAPVDFPWHGLMHGEW